MKTYYNDFNALHKSLDIMAKMMSVNDFYICATIMLSFMILSEFDITLINNDLGQYMKKILSYNWNTQYNSKKDDKYNTFEECVLDTSIVIKLQDNYVIPISQVFIQFYNRLSSVNNVNYLVFYSNSATKMSENMTDIDTSNSDEICEFNRELFQSIAKIMGLTIDMK